MSPTTDTLPITIDVLLGPDEWNAGLRSDALAGLTASPKTLTPTWLYDDTGSALYDAITRLPEYYPARTEQSILDRWAPEMVAITRSDTLVELGSGTSDKTRALLDAMAATGALQRYVPFDVADATPPRGIDPGRHGLRDRGARRGRRLPSPPGRSSK